METPDAPRAILEPPTFTPTAAPTEPDAPSDRVIVRCGERIEIITYTEEGVGCVAVTPRRAIQLAKDLLCHALRTYT
jgi:hypothetical protein